MKGQSFSPCSTCILCLTAGTAQSLQPRIIKIRIITLQSLCRTQGKQKDPWFTSGLLFYSCPTQHLISFLPRSVLSLRPENPKNIAFLDLHQGLTPMDTLLGSVLLQVSVWPWVSEVSLWALLLNAGLWQQEEKQHGTEP